MELKKLPSRTAAILCAVIMASSLIFGQAPAPKAKPAKPAAEAAVKKDTPAKPAAKPELVDLNSATGSSSWRARNRRHLRRQNHRRASLQVQGRTQVKEHRARRHLQQDRQSRDREAHEVDASVLFGSGPPAPLPKDQLL